MAEHQTSAAMRPRNRGETETRILDAARQVIAREGFAALGVNAVAAEAGCDKKLIARYFGGIDGIVAALGGELGFWLGEAPPPRGPADSYADRMLVLLEHYRASLRENPLLQRVLAAELAEPSPALARTDQARAVTIGRWMAQATHGLASPEGVDAPAINAVLLAALHYLTLRELSLGGFAGLDLSTEEGRERIDRAMARLLMRGLTP